LIVILNSTYNYLWIKEGGLSMVMVCKKHVKDILKAFDVPHEEKTNYIKPHVNFVSRMLI